MGACISPQRHNSTDLIAAVPPPSSGRVAQLDDTPTVNGKDKDVGPTFSLPHSTLTPIRVDDLQENDTTTITTTSIINPSTLASSTTTSPPTTSASIPKKSKQLPPLELGIKEEIEAEDNRVKPMDEEKADEDAATSSDEDEDEEEEGNTIREEDEDSEDDEAELTPERAREIADATAAIHIVHSAPVRKGLRGLLSTSTSNQSVPRTFSGTALAARKKGIKWNVADGAMVWKDRPTINGNTITSIIDEKAAGEKWKRKGSTQGEGKALHKSPQSRSRKVLSSHSSDATAAKEGDDAVSVLPSAITIAPTSLISPSHARISSTSSNGSPTIGAIAPRQYTSSARIAGSSSFKARITAPHHEREGSIGGGTSSLTHTLSSSTNFLLRLTPDMITCLSLTSLQQLFLLYSKAGRNIRDRTGAWGEKEKRRQQRKHERNRSTAGSGAGGSIGSMDGLSSITGLASQRAREQSANNGNVFLQSLGLEAAPSVSTTIVSPTSTQPPPTPIIPWVDIELTCSMTSEEMSILALHLVQKKLELLVNELSASPEVVNGSVKLMSLLKSKRFLLFPGATPISANATTAAASATPPTPRNHVPPTTPRAQPAPITPRAGVHQQQQESKQQEPMTPRGSLLHAEKSESQITDLFVKCTIETMTEKIGANNFGEVTWNGMMAHWKVFSSFFFCYRSDTNPLGLPPTAAGEKKGSGSSGDKNANASSQACVIM